MGKGFWDNKRLRVTKGDEFKLADYATDLDDYFFKNDDDAKDFLEEATEDIYDLQRRLYASDNHAILIVFQAMDAAGKDSTIRHVFSGVNPQGFQVTSFKVPSKKELDHDFLWRTTLALPERGRIGIFNRSHYEEVLVCKVHPEYILGQRIPGVNSLKDIDESFWKDRYKSIRNYEKHLAKSGTVILKFFLNVSKQEQLNRFLDRIDTPRKNWKFNSADVEERSYWNDYMSAYEKAIQETSAPHAPWYVIPADNKRTMRAIVAGVVKQQLERMNLKYPEMPKGEREKMQEMRKILTS
jgi:PPK2 family polyphosphate:nucleotide phosphotransferase